MSGPLSAPGQEKVTNSWHRLWTTKQHTEGGRREREDSFTTTSYDTELPPCSCAHIKWIQSPNQPLKRKYWNGLRSSLLFYMLPDKRLNGAARNQKEKRRTSECACKLSSVNLQVILTGLSHVDTQTTSRQTARARLRTHAHIKRHAWSTLQPSALCSLLGWLPRPPHPSPADPGSDPHSRSVTRWPTWHRVSSAGICIWTLAQLWREKQKRGHLWQITSWLLLWLPLRVPNCIFPLCCGLQSFLYFLFLVSHNVSAWFIVKQLVSSCALLCLSTTVVVGVLVSYSARNVTLTRQSEGLHLHKRAEFSKKVKTKPPFWLSLQNPLHARD